MIIWWDVHAETVIKPTSGMVVSFISLTFVCPDFIIYHKIFPFELRFFELGKDSFASDIDNFIVALLDFHGKFLIN